MTARPAGERHAREAEVRAALELMPQMVWTTTADGYHDYYNERWYAYTGMPRPGDPEASAEGWNWKTYLHPTDYERTLAVWEHSLATGESYEIEYRFKEKATGAYRWFLGRALPLRDRAGEIVRWFGTCTDVDDHKRAEESLRFLVAAGDTLAAARAPEEALAAVARLAVPHLADWCAVDLVGHDGQVRRVAVEHVDPAKVVLARELAARYPGRLDAPHGVRHVLRTGETEYVPDIPDDVLTAAAHDAEHLALIRALGLCSYIVAPLCDEGRVVGTITFVSAEAAHRFTPTDVGTVEELARRAGAALERARHLEELAHQNEQLQQQATELEVQAAQRDEQAIELELSNEEMQRTNAALALSEGRLALALDAGELGWWEWDVREGRVRWSAQLEAIHGLGRGEFGGTMADVEALVLPEDRARSRAHLAGALAARRERFEVRYRFVRADGAERWLEGRARLMADSTGEPVRVLGVAWDATERIALLERERAARAEADEARAAAETANAAKSAFLATMSHELRTPLNAVTGYADLLSLGIRGAVSEAQREDLARIKRSGKHLLTLINDILHFAKLEAGHVEFQVADVPLAAALAEMEALVAPQLAARRLGYHYEPCDPQFAARADRERVQQVLLNLLTNAVKFTPPGGRVSLSCAADGPWVRVQVRDNGVGIPADKISAVFDPFVQVDRKLSRPSEGVGLGLAISRDLARGMGGDLTAESAVGVGSTFTLTLPRA